MSRDTLPQSHGDCHTSHDTALFNASISIACQLFNEKGVISTALGDIAKRQGIAKPVLNKLIRNKPTLVNHCLQAFKQDLCKHVIEPLKNAYVLLDTQGGEKRLADQLFNFFMQPKHRWAFAQAAAFSHLSDETEECLHIMFSEWVGQLSAALCICQPSALIRETTDTAHHLVHELVGCLVFFSLYEQADESLESTCERIAGTLAMARAGQLNKRPIPL